MSGQLTGHSEQHSRIIVRKSNLRGRDSISRTLTKAALPAKMRIAANNAETFHRESPLHWPQSLGVMRAKLSPQNQVASAGPRLTRAAATARGCPGAASERPGRIVAPQGSPAPPSCARCSRTNWRPWVHRRTSSFRGRGYDGGYDALRRYARRWAEQHGEATEVTPGPMKRAQHGNARQRRAV
jgi:hypothetical protein